MTEVDRLRSAHDRVLDRIAAAATRAGRDPAAVQLVAVTKTVDADRVRAAADAGLTTFGENRVQEGASKRPLVGAGAWHLIGPLQSNKARKALQAFDVIQTVDSVDLAVRLDRILNETAATAPYPVLVQVNVDRDPAKAGFGADNLVRSIDDLLALDRLELRGLMTVGRLVDDPTEARATFAGLRELSISLRADRHELGAELSMGMSDDFEIAIEEGATIVRVGRALFGDRPT